MIDYPHRYAIFRKNSPLYGYMLILPSGDELLAYKEFLLQHFPKDFDRIVSDEDADILKKFKKIVTFAQISGILSPQTGT